MPQVLFGALAIYTWALMMFVDRDAIEEGLALYALTVAPTVLFVLASLPAVLKMRWEASTLALLCFAIGVAWFAIARGDTATAASVASLAFMLIAIRESKATVPLWLVNTLFLVSIPACELMWAMGVGNYGAIPGQASDPEHAWRVSLFPINVTPSWLFALVVLAMNYFRQGRGRLPMIALALYFIAMSGSRTAMIVVLLSIGFLACTHLVRFRDRLFYKAYIPLALVVLVVALNASAILTVLTGLDNPILNLVLFKSEAGAVDETQVSDSIVRTLLWSLHLDIFMANPWIGHGTFSLREVAPEIERFGSFGSEAFLTGLVARVGALAGFFLLALHYFARDARSRADRMAFCLLMMFAVTALTYGSYIVPYDFNFLMLFGAMNLRRKCVQFGISTDAPPT